MVAGYSAAQVRAAEAPHLERGEPLMRMAASALARVVREVLAGREVAQADAAVLVLAGTGDNGGDALFAAAELAASGVRVDVVPTGTLLHEKGAWAAVAAGARIWESVTPEAVARAGAAASVLVDGILGTGTSAVPALRGTAREIVAALLPVLDGERRPTVVAVDLPSGIHPDDGSVPDPTVLRADRTVTFGAAKAGLLLEPGADYAGDLTVVDLGLGPELSLVDPVVERS
jgi:NAD(P)H-hydrate epimerase